MSNPVILLGDVHGQFGLLKEKLSRHSAAKLIIQVGDLGLGFALNYDYQNKKTGLWEVHKGAADPETFPDNFKFIRGNHDDPAKCRQYPNYLGDYGVITEYFPDNMKAFFIGGAFSIDRANRTQGIDWWHDEELSYADLNNAITLYEQTKPDIVISHDCPKFVYSQLVSHHIPEHSRTAHALQQMFEIHRPKAWFFGHHHQNKIIDVGVTRFVCVNSTDTVTINKILDLPRKKAKLAKDEKTVVSRIKKKVQGGDTNLSPSSKELS